MTTNAPLTPRLCLTNPRDRYSLLMQPGRRRSSSPYLSTILLVVAPCPAASAASSRRAGIRETKPNPLPRVRGRGQGERMWLLVVQASCLRLSEVQARTPAPQSCNRHLRLPCRLHNPGRTHMPSFAPIDPPAPSKGPAPSPPPQSSPPHLSLTRRPPNPTPTTNTRATL